MKLIATDLDGTLLNSNHEISKENIEALKYAQEKGIEITIATGRTYKDALHILDKANLKAHIISNNGSVVHTKNGKTLKSWCINKTSIKNIIGWLNQNNYFYQLCTDEYIYVPSNSKELIRNDFRLAMKSNNDLSEEIVEKTIELIFSQYGIRFYDDVNNLINSEIDFCTISALSFDENKLKYGRDYCSNLKDLSMVVSLKYNFELVNKDASKGTALEYLSNYLNISLDDVIAFGDNYNDLSMFKKAGTSVAMANADLQIKDRCDFVTLSNNENGVGRFIYKHIEKLNLESTPA